MQARAAQRRICRIYRVSAGAGPCACGQRCAAL